MSLEAHIKSLNAKVSNLQGQIDYAYSHHMETADLKKERLIYLDTIEKLTHSKQD